MAYAFVNNSELRQLLLTLYREKEDFQNHMHQILKVTENIAEQASDLEASN